jgi:hypothetical protein
VPYVDKVKSVKKTRGFPNRGERYGAKYELDTLLLTSSSVELTAVCVITKKINTQLIHNGTHRYVTSRPLQITTIHNE